MTDNSQKLEKVNQAYQLAVSHYVSGKLPLATFAKTMAKLQEAARTAGGDLKVDDIVALAKRREAGFKDRIMTSTVETMTKTVWKEFKKEAGIKSSGFFKKADASVGSHIEKYRKAHEQWQASVIKTKAGDHKLLMKAFSAGVDLKEALEKFIKAKEFKDEVGTALRAKCQDFVDAMDVETKKLAVLTKEENDDTDFQNTLGTFILK